MNYLRCVRDKNKKYIDFDEIKKSEVSHIYMPVETIDDTLNSFISSYPDCTVYLDTHILSHEKNLCLLSLAKKYFNPLLNKQHILLISDEKEVLYELPFLFVELYFKDNALAAVAELINLCADTKQKKIITNLLLYQITKDIKFLNNIMKQNVNLDLFKMTERFLFSMGDKEIAKSILNTFSNNVKKPQNYLKNELGELKRSQEINVNKTAENKNLVLIHLESISNLIYNFNKPLLTELTKLMDKSLNFTRFYTSATSTIMSVSTIFYGNDFEVDHFKEYDDVIINDSYNENLFKTLNKSGYKTQAIAAYSRELPHAMRDSSIWDDGATIYTPNYSHLDFIKNLETFIIENKNEKFALFVDNKYTHCSVNDELTSDTTTFEQKMELSYISLNETIKCLAESLQKNNLLKNTIIAAYGDHGDDKWTRGINYGFTHSTEPYASITNTPFLIYNEDFKPIIVNKIISSIDVKYMLLFLLGIENTDNFPYSGKNTLKEDNNYVFSQSCFSNQREYEKIRSQNYVKLNDYNDTEYKNKSFSIYNDSYCLVVSNKGIEFFNTASDPLCYNNLLRFYDFDEKGYALAFENYNAWRVHFRTEIMRDTQIYMCLKNFYELRDALVIRIKAKNDLITDEDTDFFDMENFFKINRSGI